MKTREIFKAMLFFAGIIMLAAACNKKDDSPTIDFDMAIPTNWTYTVYGGTGVVYHAVSPKKNQHDSVSEDLFVLKYVMDNADLQTFYVSYVTELAKDTSYHALSITDTTINGVDAVKLTHLQKLIAVNQARNDTVILDFKIQKYIMVNKNSGYVVSFNAPSATFNEFHPLFDLMIATFNFKE
jgi:hypothetical protein